LKEYKNLNAEAIKRQYLDKAPEKFSYDSIESLQHDIHKWTSSQSAVHYFVKEVEVSLANLPLPSQIVFVDTPGLDDVLEYRSNVTKNYIKRANAVLVCVFCKWLPGSSLDTIFQVFDNVGDKVEKVYILGTQTDVFYSPIEDWSKQKEEWIDYLKGGSGFRSEELARKNIIGVAASLIMNLLESTTDGRQKAELVHFAKTRLASDDSALDDQILSARIEELSNVTFLKEKIQRELVAKYADLLLDDITSNYQLCYNETVKVLETLRGNADELIRSTQLTGGELSRKLEEQQEALDLISQHQKEVEKVKILFRQQIGSMLSELKKQIRQ